MKKMFTIVIMVIVCATALFADVLEIARTDESLVVTQSADGYMIDSYVGEELADLGFEFTTITSDDMSELYEMGVNLGMEYGLRAAEAGDVYQLTAIEDNGSAAMTIVSLDISEFRDILGLV